MPVTTTSFPHFRPGGSSAGATAIPALLAGVWAFPGATASGGGGSLIAARPNDGSGLWADSSNTGYLHYTGTAANPAGAGLTIACTHGYTGLYDFSSGMTSGTLLYVDAAVNSVFTKIHFRGTVLIGANTGDNFTFNGCVFDNAGAGAGSQSFGTQLYLSTLLTQNYCTFKPIDYTTPPGNSGSVSSSPTAPGTPCASSWQALNANSSGSQTGSAVVKRYNCDVWGNAGMQDMFNGTAGNHSLLSHCYVHDQADTDSSGGCGYHHDGLGPIGPAVFDQGYVDAVNCTFASLGNTSGLSIQQCTCHDMTFTGNYLSGWGYTVNLGGTMGGTSSAGGDYNITFENNVYSAEMAVLFGSCYATWAWNSSGSGSSGQGMVWRGNQYQVRSGDANGNYTTADNAKYWWPSDRVSHAGDYTG